ncbi:unnamed protein product [Arctogadus glacialis]
MAAEVTRSVRRKVPCVKPGDVPCEVCTGTKLKAVKSCLNCQTSCCHAHLEPHQRVTGLRRHRLVEPMDRLEDRLCTTHSQLLEPFCQTEQVFVCQICTEMGHTFHPFVPLKEECKVRTAQLGKIEAEVQQRIQHRQGDPIHNKTEKGGRRQRAVRRRAGPHRSDAHHRKGLVGLPQKRSTRIGNQQRNNVKVSSKS